MPYRKSRPTPKDGTSVDCYGRRVKLIVHLDGVEPVSVQRLFAFEDGDPKREVPSARKKQSIFRVRKGVPTLPSDSISARTGVRTTYQLTPEDWDVIAAVAKKGWQRTLIALFRATQTKHLIHKRTVTQQCRVLLERSRLLALRRLLASISAYDIEKQQGISYTFQYFPESRGWYAFAKVGFF